MLHKIGRKWHFCLKVGVLPHSTLLETLVESSQQRCSEQHYIEVCQKLFQICGQQNAVVSLDFVS